jgi:hypothetical protein
MSRMPNYDVRNDGIGPYAVFYCERCSREYRSQPDVGGTIAKDIGKDALGGALRGIPLFGGALADRAVGEDPRYISHLTPQQLDNAWKQVQVNFRECPTCQLVVCLSDWDSQSGFCTEDSPRKTEIVEAQAEQAGAVIKGIANVFGLGDAVKQATQAAKTASSQAARCPKDGTVAAPGTKFCPECGSAMVQPAADPCPSCGADAKGAKFCPQCGTKIERTPQVVNCPNCGTETKGAKFCPECGTKVG